MELLAKMKVNKLTMMELTFLTGVPSLCSDLAMRSFKMTSLNLLDLKTKFQIGINFA